MANFRTAVGLFACAVAAAPCLVFGGSTVNAEPIAATSARANGSCVVQDDAHLRAVSTETPEGYPNHEAWVANDAAQQEVVAINRTVSATFGDPESVSAEHQLARGLIGSTIENTTRQYVVVVDPTLVDRNALRNRLANTKLAISVRASCFPARELLRARSVLASQAWHPKAAATNYTYYLDAHDSTYRVSFAGQDREVGTALKQALGSLVTVEFGNRPTSAARNILAGGRFNDAAPHFGGAQITPQLPGTGLLCTAGFTVVFSDGRPGSVTAGHCADNFVSYASGANPYGFTEGRLRNASQDMVRLYTLFQTYDHFIHTDPGAPVQRNVTGKANPVLNSSVCVSGSVTGARCSLTVTSLNGGTACGGGICTNGLFVASRPGNVVCQPGDSGAPIYTQAANNGATIRGMLIGATASLDTCLGHRVTQVESGLGVTVSTG
jgi:hypothetical protein